MVDAAARLSPDGGVSDVREGVAAGGRPATAFSPRSLQPGDYAARAEGMIAGPAQSRVWVKAWTAHASHDCVIAELAAGGRPALTLALDVVRRGPFRVAGFMGGTHANGNFPLLDREFAGRVTAADLRSLIAHIAKQRPDIDALVMERVAPMLDGVANPLLTLPHQPSPNIALAATLSGGFDAVVARIGAKRRKKKTRGQIRKFEAAGGYRRYRATSPAEVDELSSIFFALKAERFRKLGISDVFAAADVQAFFRALFADSLAGDPPPFQLHALEVAGKVRAVTGGCVLPDRMTCEFGAIVEDDMVHASPGDFLFHENIREACAEGFALYDFSVGDEFYKRQWCDVEIRQADIIVPLTIKGHLQAGFLRSASAAKAAVKNNRRLWSAVKWLRKTAAGAPAAVPEKADDD
jgi:CelD/BcsL family acetyltransferase involved in cellulose biosynthesis